MLLLMFESIAIVIIIIIIQKSRVIIHLLKEWDLEQKSCLQATHSPSLGPRHLDAFGCMDPAAAAAALPRKDI